MKKEGHIQIENSNADADFNIVMFACTVAITRPVVVVGDDTDLLIVLVHHFSPTLHKAMYLQTSTKLNDIIHSEKDPPS